MKITITDTRTGKKTVFRDPHGFRIDVEVAEQGEELHGIYISSSGGTLRITETQDSTGCIVITKKDYKPGGNVGIVLDATRVTTGIQLTGGKANGNPVPARSANA